MKSDETSGAWIGFLLGVIPFVVFLLIVLLSRILK
jgi:hypothetical protein